jgi:hypothetical protein
MHQDRATQRNLPFRLFAGLLHAKVMIFDRRARSWAHESGPRSRLHQHRNWRVVEQAELATLHAEHPSAN